MKTLISLIAATAVLAGVGAREASAENFFKKMGRHLREAHERHEEMAREAHRNSHRRAGLVIEFGHDGYGCGDGHYETREVRVWVEESYRIEYVTVEEPGRYETRCVEVTVPGYFRNTWVAPVYRYERDCHGHTVKVLVKAGYYKKCWVPPTTRMENRRVWVDGGCRRVAKKVCVPAHYETKCVRVWVCD
jgi:Ni/Co efflux regulator RcnB